MKKTAAKKTKAVRKTTSKASKTTAAAKRTPPRKAGAKATAQPAKRMSKTKRPPAKAKSPKPVKKRFTLAEAEWTLISTLKDRVSAIGAKVKRNELVRAALKQLAALTPEQVKSLVAGLPKLK